jgi:hypothetical protein
MYKIDVGCYRSEEMQIVSGAMGKQRVHYMAVPAVNVQAEMETFLAWLNTDQGLDPVIKSASGSTIMPCCKRSNTARAMSLNGCSGF